MKGQGSNTLLLLGAAAVLIAVGVYAGLIPINFGGNAGGIPAPAGACINEGEPYYYACSNGQQIVSHICRQGAWLRTTTQCEGGALPTATPFIPTIPAPSTPPCSEGLYCVVSGVQGTTHWNGVSCLCNPVTPSATFYPTFYPTIIPTIAPTPTPYVCDRREGQTCSWMADPVNPRCCVSGLNCEWVGLVMQCVKVGAVSTPIPTGQPCPTGQGCVTELSHLAGVWVYDFNLPEQLRCYCVSLGGGNQPAGSTCNLWAGNTCQPYINDKCCVGACGLGSGWDLIKGFYCR